MPKANYSYLDCAKKMPRLRHKVGEKFSVETSEVIKWLIAQPEIMSKVFNLASSHGVIIYDHNTGEWKGADTP